MRLTRTTSQEDWQAAWKQAQRHVDVGYAHELVERTAGRVRAVVKGFDSIAVAWSGGKDSLALEIVMEAAGVRRSVIVLAHEELEFPCFEKYVKDHAPENLHIERRETVNLEWLQARPNMLFPATSSLASRWYAQVQHSGQRTFAQREGIDLMIYGRRLSDGNSNLGQANGNMYKDKAGYWRYSPLARWSHEEVLSVLAAYRKTLPEIYEYPRGFLVGTGPWPARTGTSSLRQGWEEIAQIDPELLDRGSRAGLPGAESATSRL